MDLCEFPDIDIDHLLDASTPLEEGFRQISTPRVNARAREKHSRLAERIAQSDDLIRQVKQLQIQNKQLADLQRTAQEVTDLYKKEKQQRIALQKQSQQLGERCVELEKELDAQVINCENLQEELQTRALPVDAKEVLAVLMQLEQRLGDDAGLVRRDQNIVKKLKDYCKTANITLPTPKSPNPRNKRRSQATQTNQEPVEEKPTQNCVAVQVDRLIETRDQGTQHKNTTTTRGTTTASFIKKHDVGTSFPEPKPLPNVRQILDEMLSWRDEPLRPLSPLRDLLPEVEDIPVTVSVATCTTLCNIHREIDFMSELPSQIKVSASRPPSRTMLDSVKEEARSSRELAKELLNFLPQNQSCLANLPPQAFEELWQVFGQMVLALLQRRSNTALATPPTVSQADFTSYLYELYEDAQGQPELTPSSSNAGKRDFATGTDCMDVGTDPIIAPPNISHSGDVTPIRLPPKPRERKRSKSKKRKAVASIIKPIPKRQCKEMGNTEAQKSTKESEEPEMEPKEEQKSTKESEESEPETAIQFLSNLTTFNNANCDNLDMELDEEEMYLLQLTSKPAMREEQENARKGDDLQVVGCENQCLDLPAVQEGNNSSLKDDIELALTGNTEETEYFDRITCNEAENKSEEPENIASLPDSSLEGTIASGLSSINSNACVGQKNKSREQDDSDFDNESTLCEEQLPNEEIDSDLNSCEELSIEISRPVSLETAEETDKYLYSSDSDNEEKTIQSIGGTILDNNSCKSNKSKEDDPAKQNKLNAYHLFGSDSDMESETSEGQLSKAETDWSPTESKEELIEGEPEQQFSKDETELDLFESEEEFKERDTESCNKLLLEETKSDPIEADDEFDESEPESSGEQLSNKETELSEINSVEELPGIEAYSDGIKDLVLIPANFKDCNEPEDKPDGKQKVPNEEQPLKSNISDLPLVVANRENTVDQADSVPKNPTLPFLEENEKQLPTQLSSPSLDSSDDSEDNHKLFIDVEKCPSEASEDLLPSVAAKRRRTLSEIKTPPEPGECRLTRQKAKQLLMDHNSSTERGITLVEQIRRQLKQAINRAEPLKRVCNLPVEQKTKKPEQSYTCIAESPASPRAEPMEEGVDLITEIPLEQDVVVQNDRGQPKSILQHVIDQYKSDPQLVQLRRKTLGKSQQQLCASIGKYLKGTMELETLSFEVYRLTKDAPVIVNAIIVVICKIGTEGIPLERLLNALTYFKMTQRFLAELEERLFRNTKERPATELAMQYVKLYLAAVFLEASISQGYTNPVRLLLAKLLYHYERDMPPLVMEVLRQFPTVLPHREERDYDHSDPLITVIKHLLMSRTYDMQDPDGAERLLLSKLRFEYHFQPFEPSKQQVLENLVEKLKAGRLEQLGYAFALFCRRSPHIKVVELVVTEHLMPLATSYCDLAAQNESYDERIVVLLQCISLVLKPLPLETNISAFVGLVKRLIVAVPRPGVQQAAVQAGLRLQRFGFQTIRDALQNYSPDYPLDPLTRAMIRCFAERRKQYRFLATKDKAGKK